MKFYRAYFLLFVLGLGFFQTPSIAASKTWLVDGPGRLAVIADSIFNTAPGTNHHIRFKTYVNVGAFKLDRLSDSLVFERDSESAEVIEFTETLFSFQKISGPVVFKNLAFKLMNPTSIFIQGANSGSENQDLTIDGCQIFGDTQNSFFIGWYSKGTGKIEIKRSFINALNGTLKPAFDLKANIINITNNYMNINGVLNSVTISSLNLQYNSFNRMQFSLDGGNTSTLIVLHNIFGFPPTISNLTGIGSNYLFDLSKFSSNNIAENSRFGSWVGWDAQKSSAFSDPGNDTISPFGTSTSLWNFKKDGETVRGYLNPAGSFPSYNVYPNDTSIAIKVFPPSDSNSIQFRFPPAQIPRLFTGSFFKKPYSPRLDSARSFWIADTTLQISGPFAISALQPLFGKSSGKPVLFNSADSIFKKDSVGQNGSLTFINSNPAAKKFILAFDGQNTFKGKTILVNAPSGDPTLEFSAISRSGRTFFSDPIIDTAKIFAANKKQRIIYRGNKTIGFRDSTNAEMLPLDRVDAIKFSLNKLNGDTIYDPNSLAWLLPDNSIKNMEIKSGKYTGLLNFDSISQAILIEKLKIGEGKDSLVFGDVTIRTNSTYGHQLIVHDSPISISDTTFPFMGNFSKGYSFSWPGRKIDDSLSIDWATDTISGHAPQILYQVRTQIDSTAMPPKILYFADSIPNQILLGNSISATLSLLDSNRTYFIANRYPIAVGITDSVDRTKDGIPTIFKNLQSSKPGDISVENSISTLGLPSVRTRLLARRKIKIDHLNLIAPYTLWFQEFPPKNNDSMVCYTKNQGLLWDSIFSVYKNGNIQVTLNPKDSIVACLEKTDYIDPTPIIPTQSPKINIDQGTITILPRIDPADTGRIDSYQIAVRRVNLDGGVSVDSSKSLLFTKPYTATRSTDTLYSYQIGYKLLNGDVHWVTIPDSNIDAKVFITKAANKANPYPAFLQSLVGFPWEGNFQNDLLALVKKEDQEKILLQKLNKGKWEVINLINLSNPDSLFKRGSAFLIGLPSIVAPKPPVAYLTQFGAATKAINFNDTVLNLEAGWSIISNPFPFPISDTSLILDGTSVSYFYELTWTGTGKTATSSWNQVPNQLDPFKGYAIHAENKTSITFRSPLQFDSEATPLKKAGSTFQALSIHLNDQNNSKLTQVLITPQSSPRPSPAPDMIQSKVVAHWDSSQGLQTKPLASIQEVNSPLVVVSAEAQKIKIQMDANSQNTDLALWNPTNQTLSHLTTSPEVNLKPGTNSFLILSVPEGQWEATKKRLQQQAPGTFALLGNFPNPFSKSTRIQYTIPFSANSSSSINPHSKSQIDWEVRDLAGRIIFTNTEKNILSGTHEFTLPTSNWPIGQFILRATFTSDQAPITLQRKILHLNSGK